MGEGARQDGRWAPGLGDPPAPAAPQLRLLALGPHPPPAHLGWPGGAGESGRSLGFRRSNLPKQTAVCTPSSVSSPATNNAFFHLVSAHPGSVHTPLPACGGDPKPLSHPNFPRHLLPRPGAAGTLGKEGSLSWQ